MINLPLASLTYISRSCIAADVADAEVAQIAEQSRRRNPNCLITGALLFTGESFAQTVEGPEYEVARLYDWIKYDRRHTDALIVHSSPLRSRTFSAWWMAYWGRTSFAEKFVEACRVDNLQSDKRCVDELRELLYLFASQQQVTSDRIEL